MHSAYVFGALFTDACCYDGEVSVSQSGVSTSAQCGWVAKKFTTWTQDLRPDLPIVREGAYRAQENTREWHHI